MVASKQGRLDPRPFEKFAFVPMQASGTADGLTEKARKELIRSHARRAGLERERLYTGSRLPERDNVIGSTPPLPVFGQFSKFRSVRPIVKKNRLLQARSGKGLDRKRLEPLETEKHEDFASIRKTIPLAGNSASYESLQIFRDNGVIDPFDSLPVSLGPQQRMLLNYCRSPTSVLKSIVATLVYCALLSIC